MLLGQQKHLKTVQEELAESKAALQWMEEVQEQLKKELGDQTEKIMAMEQEKQEQATLVGLLRAELKVLKEIHQQQQL